MFDLSTYCLVRTEIQKLLHYAFYINGFFRLSTCFFGLMSQNKRLPATSDGQLLLETCVHGIQILIWW